MKRRAFIQSIGAAAGLLGAGKAAHAQFATRPEMVPSGLSGRMKSTWSWRRDPYPLAKGPHLFSDWRFVRAGELKWISEAGVQQLQGAGGFQEARADTVDVAHGVMIRPQPSQLGERIEDVWPGSLVREGGRYRLWYYFAPGMVWFLPEFEGRDLDRLRKSLSPVLLYAESDDGVHWHKPKLRSESALPGWHNIAYSGSVVTRKGLHQPAVFRDPSAPASARYKMIHGGFVGGPGRESEVRATLEDFRRHRPNAIDPVVMLDYPTKLSCMYGATSPDGLRWSPIPEPFLLHDSDTANRAYYDEALSKYVWYGRLTYLGRRAVGRSESDDFRSFSPPEIVLAPGLDYAPDEDWYTSAKTIYPGSKSAHLMFPSKFRRRDETAWVYLYSSPDGIHWQGITEEPVVREVSGMRDPDAFILAGGDLVVLPGERVGVMCHASLLPHKYPRRAGMPASITFWATWPRERLSAIEASQAGWFATPELEISGNSLLLNVMTQRAGKIQVEVAQGKNPQAVAGRTFADCDPISGDHPKRRVTWGGQSQITPNGVKRVVFRFRMEQAKLFAFEIV
jgi:hypothetical protein